MTTEPRGHRSALIKGVRLVQKGKLNTEEERSTGRSTLNQKHAESKKFQRITLGWTRGNSKGIATGEYRDQEIIKNVEKRYEWKWKRVAINRSDLRRPGSGARKQAGSPNEREKKTF